MSTRKARTHPAVLFAAFTALLVKEPLTRKQMIRGLDIPDDANSQRRLRVYLEALEAKGLVEIIGYGPGGMGVGRGPEIWKWIGTN